MNKQEVMTVSTYTIGDNLNIAGSNTANAVFTGTGWDYWSNYYYPTIIRESYPVWVQEKAQDKGKLAFEVIKALQDKKLLKLDKVADFIEAMDILLKTL